MPARMPRRLLMLLCLAALAAGAGRMRRGRRGAGRGGARPRGARRSTLDGIDYNVFITRQLNTRITPDKAYVEAGTEPEPGRDALRRLHPGLQPLGRGGTAQAADEFKIVDNQGNEFEPEELPEENHSPTTRASCCREECIPEAGSVAQLGPTAGSMLLFRLPLANTEYRPLELEVQGEGDEHLDVRARHLAQRCAEPVSKHDARRRALRVAPPAPARTSSTATTIRGRPAGA